MFSIFVMGETIIEGGEVPANVERFEDLLEQSQAESVEIAENLAHYAHDAKIRNIVLPDRRARLAYLGLHKVWNHAFPREEKPQIYFVNPVGFHTGDRSQREIIKGIEKNHPYLWARRKERTLIFDACHHTGVTARTLKRRLNKAGFNKVYVGSAQLPTKVSRDVIDFVAIRREALNACWPFGDDTMVYKPFNSILSMKSTNPFDRRDGRGLRREILDLFKERGYD